MSTDQRSTALHGERRRQRTLVTRIFVHGDELLTRDAVFGVRDLT